MDDENCQTITFRSAGYFFPAAFFLLSLFLLSNALGPLTRQTNVAAAIAAMALCGTTLLPYQSETRRRVIAVLLLTGLFYAIVGVAYSRIPFLWHFAQTGSQFLSHTPARWFGQHQLFGATAFGLPILILFIIFNFSAYWLADFSPQSESSTSKRDVKTTKRFLLTMLALFFIHIFWAILQKPVIALLTQWVADNHAHDQSRIHLTPLHLLIFPFLLDSMPTYLFWRTCRFNPLNYRLQNLSKTIAAGFMSLSLLASLLLSWPDWAAAAKSNKNIFILNRGYFNWEKPKFGQYGLTSAGMFGFLPDYLRTLAYTVTVDSLLTKENLQQAQVFVVINLHRMLKAEEKQAIFQFVENGGALLVLGDHTGLGEMMPPLSDLLQDTGIQFNFDSAHYLKDAWNHAFELMPHPINAAVKNEDDVGISIGASLHLLPFKARQVITAKYGFSDFGNWLNKKNAYLGDRSYNPGELLGDIVLVAEGKLGKGKVLVFGDTSSLQNGAMARAFTFVDGLLHWLATAKDDNNRTFRDVIGMLLLLAMPILLLNLVRRHKSMALVLIVFGGLVLGILITSVLASSHRHQTVPTGHAAYVDMSHLERFQIYGDDGIWSLLYTLMRSDYLPFVHTRFSKPALVASKIFIKIAPAKSLSNDELQLVDKYLRAGGLVVWAVGYEEKEGSENFLRQYGLSLDNVPLGPVPKAQTDRGLTFHTAWPVVFADTHAVKILCSGWSYPLIVEKQIGTGRLVLIGDSEFLLARNLEGAPRAQEENLRFIESLVKEEKRLLSDDAIKPDEPYVTVK